MSNRNDLSSQIAQTLASPISDAYTERRSRYWGKNNPSGDRRGRSPSIKAPQARHPKPVAQITKDLRNLDINGRVLEAPRPYPVTDDEGEVKLDDYIRKKPREKNTMSRAQDKKTEIITSDKSDSGPFELDATHERKPSKRRPRSIEAPEPRRLHETNSIPHPRGTRPRISGPGGTALKPTSRRLNEPKSYFSDTTDSDSTDNETRSNPRRSKMTHGGTLVASPELMTKSEPRRRVSNSTTHNNGDGQTKVLRHTDKCNLPKGPRDMPRKRDGE